MKREKTRQQACAVICVQFRVTGHGYGTSDEEFWRDEQAKHLDQLLAQRNLGALWRDQAGAGSMEIFLIIPAAENRDMAQDVTQAVQAIQTDLTGRELIEWAKIASLEPAPDGSTYPNEWTAPWHLHWPRGGRFSLTEF